MEKLQTLFLVGGGALASCNFLGNGQLLIRESCKFAQFFGLHVTLTHPLHEKSVRSGLGESHFAQEGKHWHGTTCGCPPMVLLLLLTIYVCNLVCLTSDFIFHFFFYLQAKKIFCQKLDYTETSNPWFQALHIDFSVCNLYVIEHGGVGRRKESMPTKLAKKQTSKKVWGKTSHQAGYVFQFWSVVGEIYERFAIFSDFFPIQIWEYFDKISY